MVIKIGLLLLVILIIMLLYNHFKPEYYEQVVDVGRIENVRLIRDISTLEDFKPEGINILPKYYSSTNYLDTLEAMHLHTRTTAHISLCPSREKAAEDYTFYKNTIHIPIQYERIIGPNDAICMTKSERTRDEDFTGLIKENGFYSHVLFVKVKKA
jgi:hypothetical protein